MRRVDKALKMLWVAQGLCVCESSILVVSMVRETVMVADFGGDGFMRNSGAACLGPMLGA